MKQKKVNPSRPVRRPVRQEDFIPRSRPCTASLPSRPAVSFLGKLTLFGLYEENLLEIQNARQWSDKRCKLYDRVMCQHLGPLFAERPLEDLSLDDYVRLWDQLLLKNLSEAAVSSAYTLVRLLAEMALRRGISFVYFWGDVHELLKEKRKSGKIRFKLSDPAAQDKELRGTRISRSLPVGAELRLMNLALDRINERGEVIAGILMFLLGLRTSEACGARFGDLAEVHPGCWALKRITARDPNSGSLDERAKTENGYRLIPIPAFLAAIILERRDKLQARYPHKNIGKWTIACSGRDYGRSADQRKVNAEMTLLYMDSGCDREIMIICQEELKYDQASKEDCEGSLVAYLGRHQMITELVAVGMPERYIFHLAGHAQMDPVADAADLSNLDTFLEVSDYLNRRPIVQLLDRSVMPARLEVTCPTELSRFCDGEIDIRFQPADDAVFHFTAVLTELEPSDPLAIEIEGCDQIEEERLPCRPTGSSLLCNVPYLRQLAADNRNADPDHELILNWEDVPEEYSFSVAEPPEVRPLTLSKRKSYRRRGSETDSPSREKKALASSVFAETLSCLDETGHAGVPDDSLFVLSNPGACGKKIRMENGRTPVRFLAYAPDRHNYVVSPNGTLCPFPARTRLDLVLNDPGGEQLRSAFLSGAFLVSHAGAPSSSTKLVLLTAQGSLVCLAAERLQSLPSAGAELVKLSPKDGAVVSACFLEPGQDLLIVSAGGRGLRLASDSLYAKKSLGVQAIRGIRLKPGDAAVTCLPYSGEELFLAKSDGRLSCIGSSIPSRKGTDSEGVILAEGAPIVSAFPRPDVVAMVDSLGRLVFFDASAFRSKGKGKKGVAAQSVAAGCRLAYACGIHYSQAPSAEASAPPAADPSSDEPR